MRKKITISKVYLKQIDSFVKDLIIHEKEQFKLDFIEHIKYELRVLKDCSEKHIVTTYIRECIPLIKDYSTTFELIKEQLKTKSRQKLVVLYTSNTNVDSDNLISIYFNEIKKEYILHPVQEQDEVEFNEENKDIFLKNNLKLVIDVAKRYTGLGLPFEDLIQAGNIGLCTAFERYDKNRANLRISIIKDINRQNDDFISLETATEIIQRNFVYSKNLDQTINKLPKEGFENKQLFIDWANKNIKTAVFSSVAFQWIRANILTELNKYSKVLRVPKLPDEEKQSTIIVNLDSINTHTNDCYHDNQISDISNENFLIEDQEIENNNKQQVLSGIIDTILNKNLTTLEKRILKKSFGIGYPYQLNSLEIAENEGLSANKVKYILKIALGKVTNGCSESQLKMLKDIMYA